MKYPKVPIITFFVLAFLFKGIVELNNGNAKKPPRTPPRRFKILDTQLVKRRHRQKNQL